MKQNQIKDLNNLKVENLENIFNVYKDDNKNYFYNLLQTVVIPSNLPRGYYTEYIVKEQDTWPYISYKAYHTPNLWWVILGANDIINPTQMPVIGTKIKLLKIEVVKSIIEQITTQES